MSRIAIIALFLLIVSHISAQTAPPADLVTIEQNLKKLNVLGSVLYLAAHPDDENTRLLAYLAQEKHYRTGYLSLTRGDGGQNLLGNEQGETLGLIRTQELLAARKFDGAEQFFTRANDFGFSKGPTETLKIWDREKVLGDVVWVIRKFRPDVLICRFPTTGEGGHGHHTSSAILAQEAFRAAADSSRFPEQLKFVKTWQTKRLLWNTFNFGSINTIGSDQFKVDVGVYNAVLGKGYGELAAESRSNHKTQGFGSPRQRGASFEYFKTISGTAPHADLMDDVDVTWNRAGEPALGILLSTIIKNFDPEKPYQSVPDLVGLLNKVEKISDLYWREQKIKELSTLIVQCAGLWFESYATQPVFAIGDSIAVHPQMLSRYGLNVKLNGISFASTHEHFDNKVLLENQIETFTISALAEKTTQPYWLESPHAIGTYTINAPENVGNPENPDLPALSYDFTIAGHEIHYQSRIVYKYVDPVRGEVYQGITVAPPVTATIAEQDYIFNSNQAQSIQVKLQSFTSCSGSISLNPIKGWTITPNKIEFLSKQKACP